MLASFPEFLLIRPDDTPVGQRMRNLIDLIVQEAEGNELGVTAIMDNLSDMLFLYIIRHTLHVNPRLSPLLITMADNHLQLATQALEEIFPGIRKRLLWQGAPSIMFQKHHS